VIQNTNVPASGSSGSLSALLSQQSKAAQAAPAAGSPQAKPGADSTSEEEALASLGNEDFTAGVSSIDDPQQALSAIQAARQSILASPNAALQAQANVDPERAARLLQ
jgi:hypothetical protein